MARIVPRRACWAKAVSLSKVIDLRSAGSMRAKTASMTEMVSAAVFPTSLAASVTRDLRSWRTSTGRVRLQMMRSPSQWPTSVLASAFLGPFVDGDAILDRISRRPRSERTPAFVTSREITPQLLGLLGGAVDEGVDRVAPRGPQTTFISALQPARDLLGCPPSARRSRTKVRKALSFSINASRRLRN
jgi:hypothetical protein